MTLTPRGRIVPDTHPIEPYDSIAHAASGTRAVSSPAIYREGVGRTNIGEPQRVYREGCPASTVGQPQRVWRGQ
jgi:hypothetical protein